MLQSTLNFRSSVETPGKSRTKVEFSRRWITAVKWMLPVPPLPLARAESATAMPRSLSGCLLLFLLGGLRTNTRLKRRSTGGHRRPAGNTPRPSSRPFAEYEALSDTAAFRKLPGDTGERETTVKPPRNGSASRVTYTITYVRPSP